MIVITAATRSARARSRRGSQPHGGLGRGPTTVGRPLDAGQVVTVADTTHYIELDQPGVVIDAVVGQLMLTSTPRPRRPKQPHRPPRPPAHRRIDQEMAMNHTHRTTTVHRRDTAGPATSSTASPPTQRGCEHGRRHDMRFSAAVGWGVVVGIANAAAPVALWWLDASSVHALAIAMIAAIYIGFAVADGRRHVIAVECGVAGAVRDPRGRRHHAQPVAARRRILRPRMQRPVATPLPLRRRHPMVAAVLRWPSTGQSPPSSPSPSAPASASTETDRSTPGPSASTAI